MTFPIHLSSTFAQTGIAKLTHKFDYIRAGNPTRYTLEQTLASLENAKFGFAYSSGCASTMIVTHLLSSGDHIICGDDVYGGTNRYFRRVTPTYNMEVDFVDMRDHKLVEASFKKNTKLLWLETPTNPLLKVFDIAAIAEICKEKGVLLAVDNTFMTPYFQQPLGLGADIVVHSMTKYIGGHADVCMGFVATNNADIAQKLQFN